MKTLALFFILACVQLSTAQVPVFDSTQKEKTTLVAQNPITFKRTMVVVDLLTFFVFSNYDNYLGPLNLSFYHAIKDNFTFGVGIQLPFTTNKNGYGIHFEGRFYPAKQALHGLYVAPTFSYTHSTYSIGYIPIYGFSGSGLYSKEYADDAYSVGARVGYQWFRSMLTLGVGAGFDCRIYAKEYPSSGVPNPSTEVLPVLRLDFGVGW